MLLPVSVAQADVQFVSQSVFLSQPSAPAGTTMLIYASVVNTSISLAFNGTAIFRDGVIELGRVGVALSPGEARVVSISWTPGAGSHNINALLEESDGTPVSTQMASSTEATAMFTIEAPPPPPVPDPIPQTDTSSGGRAGDHTSTLVAPATAIADSIISTLPPVASSTIVAIFSTVDDARAAIVSVLDSQISSASRAIIKATPPALEKMTSVGGSKKQSASSTPSSLIVSNSASSTVSGTASDIFSSLYLDLLLFLRFLLVSASLSYLCVLSVIIFGLYLLYCRLSLR